MSVLGWTKKPSARFPLNDGQVLYLGGKYRNIVQSDMKRFRPGLQIRFADTIEVALSELATGEFWTIILDDGVDGQSAIKLLDALRFGDGPNAFTPVRIVELQHQSWIAEVVLAYEDVVAIPYGKAPRQKGRAKADRAKPDDTGANRKIIGFQPMSVQYLRNAG